MRLFTAIDFSPTIKQGLDQMAQALFDDAVFARIPRLENHHLTLVFLGETTAAAPIITALGRVQAAPFLLQSGPVGRFRRPGGDIIWLGLQPSAPLQALHDILHQALSVAGCHLEQRPYRPHLTLAREAVLPEDCSLAEFGRRFPPLSIPVESFCLFESRREAGQLVYHKLFEQVLEEKKSG